MKRQRVKLPKWLIVYLIVATIAFVIGLSWSISMANEHPESSGYRNAAFGVFVGWFILLIIPRLFANVFAERRKIEKLQREEEQRQADIRREQMLKEIMERREKAIDEYLASHPTATRTEAYKVLYPDENSSTIINHIYTDRVDVYEKHIHEAEKFTYVFCSYCGVKNKSIDKTCSQCGAVLEQRTE
jgi:hypothetical protein